MLKKEQSIEWFRRNPTANLKSWNDFAKENPEISYPVFREAFHFLNKISSNFNLKVVKGMITDENREVMIAQLEYTIEREFTALGKEMKRLHDWQTNLEEKREFLRELKDYQKRKDAIPLSKEGSIPA